MGKGFVRRPDLEGSNSLFNYAYAIVRSCVARAVCAAGLLPMFGVHHRNTLNAFCLVDDLMEPLRPVADAFVVQHLEATEHTATLDTPAKKYLSTILAHKLDCKDGLTAFIAATNTVAQSFADCVLARESALSLPLLQQPALADG